MINVTIGKRCKMWLETFETFEKCIDSEILADLSLAEDLGLITKKQSADLWFWRSDACKWLNNPDCEVFE